jgi:hypothetical protein
MRLLSTALLFCSLTLSSSLAADEFKLEPGYALLLNGKDLSGWKTIAPKGKESISLEGKSEAFGGRFKVQAGELILDPKVKGDVRIETEKEFSTDTTIRFEFKPGEGCNNDLFYRGTKFDIKKPDVKNMKDGEWNEFEIIVKDGKAEFRCNGESIKKQTIKGEKSTFGIRAEFGPISIRNLRIKE